MPAKKEIDLKRFKELYEKGLTTKELCAIFDVTSSSIMRLKTKCGYLTNKFIKIQNEIPKDEIYDLFVNQKKTINELAEHYNKKKNFIVEVLQFYDINQKERKLDISYEQLYQDYKVDKMSYEQISKKYNISIHEVTEKIKEYKFEPNHFIGYISKEELYDSYIVQNKRKEEIAKQFGCSTSKISEYLVEYNIKKDPEQYHKLAKETCLKRYGVENAGWTEESQKKIKETNQEKFGKDFYIQTEEFKEKSKQTCLEKYGVKHITPKIPEINDKMKQTSLKRYKVEYHIATKECQEKSKQTFLKRYGVSHPMELEKFKIKGYETKKLNGTFGKSKEENKMYNLLQQKFGEVKRQYRSEKYPFDCDFYIPSIDLYIEYQGFWNHGKKGIKCLGPYDSSNKEHQILLAKWQNCLNKGHDAYKRAIRVWTISDPKKRKTAKDNNLNWIEFWTFEEFLKWYEKR